MSKADAAIDDASTTRPRAGMVWKDRGELPGLALVVVGVVFLVGCLTAAAAGSVAWAAGLGVAVLGAMVGGVSWIAVGRRRAAGCGRHRR